MLLTPVTGIYQLELLSPREKTRVGFIDFPVFPRELDAQFRELATKFYEIKAVCMVGSNSKFKFKSCYQTGWSSHFPDLKTQIVTGFNSNLGHLN